MPQNGVASRYWPLAKWVVCVGQAHGRNLVRLALGWGREAIPLPACCAVGPRGEYIPLHVQWTPNAATRCTKYRSS
eukprot:scaffold18487_cov143-Isochrysis_galbana.AAC.1